MTLDQVFADIEGNIKSLLSNRDEFEIPALKEMEGQMKQRIHNKGLDSDNSKIAPKYSDSYRKQFTSGSLKQFNKRPQPVNLELSSDLRNSLEVGTQSGENVLRFQDDFNKKKASYLEVKYKKEIYRPTDQEIKDAEEVLNLQIQDSLERLF